MIDSGVHAEYQTFKKNRKSKSIKYAHVDSVNIFHLIDNIYEKRNNNPVHEFDKVADITSWLQLQWVGLFKSLLQERKSERQLGEISEQVAKLDAANATMKEYLEAILRQSDSANADGIIETGRRHEKEKIDVAQFAGKIKNSKGKYIYQILRESGVDYRNTVRFFIDPKTAKSVDEKFEELINGKNFIYTKLMHNADAQRDYNETRHMLGFSQIDFTKINQAS